MFEETEKDKLRQSMAKSSLLIFINMPEVSKTITRNVMYIGIAK